jgi:hypothetical protein
MGWCIGPGSWAEVAGDACSCRIGGRGGKTFANLLATISEEAQSVIEAWLRRSLARKYAEMFSKTASIFDRIGAGNSDAFHD